MFPYNFITVDGNTGAGKTTLATMLAKEINAQLILEEFVENPFLPKFYAEPERYALSTELYFLIDRVEQLQDRLAQQDIFASPHIADYVFQKSLLYAKANLKGDEYLLFERIFHKVLTNLPEPELLIYVHSKPDRLVRNIQKRGRDFEQVVQKSYLSRVEEIYFDYFTKNQHLRILILEADELDFVTNENDYQKVKNTVMQSFEQGIHRVKL